MVGKGGRETAAQGGVRVVVDHEAVQWCAMDRPQCWTAR